MAVTAVWSWVLLRRTPGWHPELAPLVLLGGLAVAVLVAARLTGRGRRRVAAAVAGAGLLVALAGPAACALDTAATPTAAPSPRPNRPSRAPPRAADGGAAWAACSPGPPPAPSWSRCSRRYVAEGRIHWFLAWVAETFTATSVGGSTVYDLTTTG